jgi:RNA recognition motif-containing protein
MMLTIPIQVNFGKGCAFISFARKPEASRAIERLNGLVLDGKPLRVTWSRSSGMSLMAQD